MDQLLAELNAERRRLSQQIIEASRAAEEHLAARDRAPHDSEQAAECRRLEGFYLGQAIALSWVAQWLDTTLQQHAARSAGRVFSCPVLLPLDTQIAEHTLRTATPLEPADEGGPEHRNAVNVAN